MNIIKAYKMKKRRQELRKSLEDLINLIIVVDNPSNTDLDTLKTSHNTTLSYASSYQRLLNKCQEFKDKEDKEIELSVVFSLYYALSCLYSGKYNEALNNIKKTLEITTKVDNKFQMEARYMHYLATIMMTNIVAQEVFEVLEDKITQEKNLQLEIKKKIEHAEILLSDFNNEKYKAIGEEKSKEAKLRILNNQKKLYQEYLEIETEINGGDIPKEFREILNGLEDNLDYIEDEMLENNFIIQEMNNQEVVFYPTGHFPNLIYLYLQTQRAKLLFYKKEYEEFETVLLQILHHTNYTNWKEPFLVLKNGNREEVLAKIQLFNKLNTFNNYVDTLMENLQS